MAKWLGMHTVLTEDPGSNPSTYVKRRTTSYNSTSRGFDASGHCGHLYLHAHYPSLPNNLK